MTSSDEEVDLADPDVRALLVSLVDDEIDLAKVCRSSSSRSTPSCSSPRPRRSATALGLDDKLAEVKELLAELQA